MNNFTTIFFKLRYSITMNFYKKKLEEKKKYPHIQPKDTSHTLKKNKIHALKHTKKNAQLGMF